MTRTRQLSAILAIALVALTVAPALAAEPTHWTVARYTRPIVDAGEPYQAPTLDAIFPVTSEAIPDAQLFATAEPAIDPGTCIDVLVYAGTIAPPLSFESAATDPAAAVDFGTCLPRFLPAVPASNGASSTADAPPVAELPDTALR